MAALPPSRCSLRYISAGCTPQVPNLAPGPAKSKSKKQNVGHRTQDTGDRRQETGDRIQETGACPPPAGQDTGDGRGTIDDARRFLCLLNLFAAHPICCLFLTIFYFIREIRVKTLQKCARKPLFFATLRALAAPESARNKKKPLDNAQ